MSLKPTVSNTAGRKELEITSHNSFVPSFRNERVVRVDVKSSECTHVKKTKDMFSVLSQHDGSGVVFFDLEKSSLMSFHVLESSTTDKHISGPGGVVQPQPIR